jgi:hypothetical protein
LIRLIISGAALGLVHQPADLQRRLQAQRDLGLHVGQLLLEELRLRQRLVELLAVEPVLARGVPAEFGRAHDAPGDAVARAVEAAERPLQPLDMRQKRVLADLDPVHHDLAGGRGAQDSLPSIFGADRPFMPLSSTKPRMRRRDARIWPRRRRHRRRGVRDPGLGAGQR